MKKPLRAHKPPMKLTHICFYGLTFALIKERHKRATEHFCGLTFALTKNCQKRASERLHICADKRVAMKESQRERLETLLSALTKE